jgi:pimeloyl-ACP methyl ester carboxylesterase
VPYVLTEGFFDSDGVRLHYLDWGGSGRNLVLLPGLGGTAQIFRGIAPRLGDRFRVSSFTRRAHGRSDRPDSGYDIDALTDDIRRFIDFLGMERATLVGHSWAGIEIPYFATKYPERVDAVIYLDAVNVLLEPAPDLSADPVMSTLEKEPSAADMVSVDAYLGFIKRSRPDLASIWCEAVEADRRDYIAGLSRHGPATAIAAKMDAGLGRHREPAFGEVTAPALALVPGGTTHPFLPAGASDELRRAGNAHYVQHWLPRIEQRTELFRRAAPNARVVKLDTSNHTIFVAKETETLDAILGFLEDEPSAARLSP